MKRAITLVSLTAVVGAIACAQTAPSAEQTGADVPGTLKEIRVERIERTIRTLVAFGTRNTLSRQDDPKRGIGAARDWLFEQFQDISKSTGGRLRVEKQTFIQPAAPRVATPTPLTNIVATLPGDLPPERQRVLVVSGHYDSMCSSPTDSVHDAPGANDDASGTAAVLEICRALAGRRFHATIVFLCVAGEEQGLLGSTYFAEKAKQEGWNIEAMLTNDIIGGSTGGNGVHDDHSVRVFSEGIASNETQAEARVRRSVGGEEDSPSRQLARYIKESGERYVRGMKVTLIARRDRYLRGGDHIPFNERGYAAVRFTEPNEDYRRQHQNVRTENGVVYGDLPEFVDYRYVANVARINAAALAELASGPAAPEGVALLTRRLTVDTDLEWKDSADPEITGYEVVWRETTSPIWTHSRAVGKVNKVTMSGISKDNCFFGIRAVDRQGHRSQVAWPRPGR